MKKHRYAFLTATLVALLAAWSLPAQNNDTTVDTTGLPGDHFSLQGALDLFKKAQSIEEFEKSLNTEDNNVNNLDLNDDGKIDYIRVIDRMDKDVHSFVLQIPVSDKESQDVAVIELEKTGSETAVLQIIGDESFYGEQVIAEPFQEENVKAGGRGGGSSLITEPMAIVVNVWGWPCVRFVYRPAYVAWVSPWRFGVYPGWWRPWRPRPVVVFRAGLAPFRPHYCYVKTHRVVRAHAIYKPYRAYSPVYRSRREFRVRRGPGPRMHRGRGRH
jgi:hypothetical protein